MRGPPGHTRLPSFVALGHILGEINATSGFHYRVTGSIERVSVPSATLLPETTAPRRALELGGCVAHRATHVCQVSSLSDTYSGR
ncbi:hypothetical protein DPMN_039940 [Dreissena polymorpha]|uniref:Uncharacterized protein n=1 Tax=Dreissena polymorpha TaxID=45954 RepID=A0A9D4HWE0_DREPO|nr:hypothetical protein DPMN_039940 [Dreissena polymorpha]